MALRSLKINKGRTMLTVLGIVIGTTAVIAVLSIGQAIKGLITEQIEAFGSDYIQVEVKTPQTGHTSTENSFSMVGGSVVTTLKEDDAKALLRHPNVSNYYTAVLGQDTLSFKSELKKATLFGVNASFIEIDTGKVEFGRFFTDDEDNSLTKVIVLGATLKDNLFADNEAVGQSVKVGKETFTVIGVMKKRGASFGFDMDTMALLPVKTLQKKILGTDYVMMAIVTLKDINQASSTALDVEDILRDRHNIISNGVNKNKDDFAVTTMADAMEMTATIINGIQILLIALGAISLIVGGVGIMNIMYVSVMERMYEIGLRKSVGARSQDILFQFLFEAVIITLIGGILGIVVGLTLAYLVSAVATQLGFSWKFSVSLGGIFLAAGMSLFIGLTFGLYPAQKAARMSPIEALRHE